MGENSSTEAWVDTPWVDRKVQLKPSLVDASWVDRRKNLN